MAEFTDVPCACLDCRGFAWDRESAAGRALCARCNSAGCAALKAPCKAPDVYEAATGEDA